MVKGGFEFYKSIRKFIPIETIIYFINWMVVLW